MKTDSRLDYLLQRLASMNRLIDTIHADDEDGQDSGKKKKSDRNDGLFGAVTSEMFFRAEGKRRPSILGITHPSDGHPQEEMVPDFGWFRPLTYNNQTWILYWPELTV